MLVGRWLKENMVKAGLNAVNVVELVELSENMI